MNVLNSTDLAQSKSLLVLGTRGVPCRHGGFETFAEHLAPYLVGRGWRVTVYCQGEQKGGEAAFVDEWRGVRRVIITPRLGGPVGTIEFDLACIRHALHEPGLPLVLGYNTAILAAAFKARKRPFLINMDGIEWQRKKWGWPARQWLYLNEWCAATLSSTMIADHSAIAAYLKSRFGERRIETIPYGADILDTAPVAPLAAFGVEPDRYFLSIGRIEPENSILELITAYVSKPRSASFVCLGRITPNENPYHAEVMKAADGRVIFPGAVYDQSVVKALRRHALAYCHGHTVGGTNPSLVEALGAGNAIIAHDNVYNRGVAGERQLYFCDASSCSYAMDRASDDANWRVIARLEAKKRCLDDYTWDNILGKYERLCERWLAHRSHSPKGACDRLETIPFNE